MSDLKIPDLKMDDRIKKMRARLTRSHDGDDQILARLDAVEAKLDTLVAMLDPAKKKSSKKAVPKKATAKKTSAKTARTPKKPSPKS